jgi:hypothetical protein
LLFPLNQEHLMSFDKLLKDAVRDEVTRAMAPMAAAIEALKSQGIIVGKLAAALGTPARRGRPLKLSVVKGKKGKLELGGPSVCALEACGRPARSKGYCAAHYQKYRMLEKTGRLPSDWTEFAPSGSVKNITLPRGRAGAKALADLKKKSRD